MTLTAPLLAGIAAILVLLLAVIVVVVAGRKASRTLVEKRRGVANATVRDVLLGLALEEEGSLPARPDRRLRQAEQRVAMQMLERVRGAGRERVVELLVERGAVAAAQRRIRGRGAVGRASAAMFLGRCGDQHLAGGLIALLADADRNVRTAAVRAIGELGEPASVIALLAVVDGPAPVSSNVVASSILRIGRGAIEPLQSGFGDASPAVRSIVIDVLGLLGAIVAIDDIAAALDFDADSEVRISAAQALGRIGVPRGLPALRRCIENLRGPPSVRSAAAAALGRIGAVESVPALAAALVADDHDLARTAAAGLALIGPGGLARLHEIAAIPGRGCRYAREALDLHDLHDLAHGTRAALSAAA